jgi:hypothetical protein
MARRCSMSIEHASHEFSNPQRRLRLTTAVRPDRGPAHLWCRARAVRHHLVRRRQGRSATPQRPRPPRPTSSPAWPSTRRSPRTRGPRRRSSGSTTSGPVPVITRSVQPAVATHDSDGLRRGRRSRQGTHGPAQFPAAPCGNTARDGRRNHRTAALSGLLRHPRCRSDGRLPLARSSDRIAGAGGRFGRDRRLREVCGLPLLGVAGFVGHDMQPTDPGHRLRENLCPRY